VLFNGLLRYDNVGLSDLSPRVPHRRVPQLGSGIVVPRTASFQEVLSSFHDSTTSKTIPFMEPSVTSQLP
jgi:hypothetical protein